MRSLSELKSYMTPLPLYFSGNDSETLPSIPEEGDAMSLKEGFPASYSKSPTDSGAYILRSDMNALGCLASQELHYRQSGGWHTYNSEVGEGDGYCQGAVLDSFDGTYIRKVESQEEGVKRSFVMGETNLETPNIIDCNVTNVEDSDTETPRLLWKSVSRVSGIGDGVFHLNLDYSRARSMTNGEILQEDSFVIGFIILHAMAEGNYDVSSLKPLTHTTVFGDNTSVIWKNKGRFGSIIGDYPFVHFTGAGVEIVKLHYLRCSGGSGNYFMYYFAKAGTTISGSVTNMTSTATPNWVVVPLSRTVGNEEGSND